MEKHLSDMRRKLKALTRRIKNINELLDVMERICYSSAGRNCNGVRNSGVSDPTHQLVYKMEKLREKRENAILEYISLSDKLLALFEPLPEDLKGSLSLYYVSGYSWETVAEKCNISPRGIYRRRNKALKILSGKR